MDKCRKKRETPWLGGEKNYNWKGGRFHHKNGDMILKPDHPRANNGYVFEHIIIAEKALGKYLPLKAEIHHHNKTQLVICQNHAYHMFLHQRMRALKDSGHAHWRKCWVCKKYDDPINLRIYNGNYPHHKECLRSYQRNRKILSRPEVRAIMEDK